MSEKARRALKLLDELDKKRAEQIRLQRELRRSLMHEAYRHQPPRHQVPHLKAGFCAECRQQFLPGDAILEYFDDANRVVARYHYYKKECDRT